MSLETAIDGEDHGYEIKKFIAEQLSLSPEEVLYDSTLGSLGIDSIERIDLTADLEGKYDFEFSEDYIESVSDETRIRDVIDHIIHSSPKFKL